MTINEYTITFEHRGIEDEMVFSSPNILSALGLFYQKEGFLEVVSVELKKKLISDDHY